MLFLALRSGSADDPYKHVPVECHIAELELFLMSVLVRESGFKLPFAFRVEVLHFYLLREIHPVL